MSSSTAPARLEPLRLACCKSHPVRSQFWRVGKKKKKKKNTKQEKKTQLNGCETTIWPGSDCSLPLHMCVPCILNGGPPSPPPLGAGLCDGLDYNILQVGAYNVCSAQVGMLQVTAHQVTVLCREGREDRTGQEKKNHKVDGGKIRYYY